MKIFKFFVIFKIWSVVIKLVHLQIFTTVFFSVTKCKGYFSSNRYKLVQLVNERSLRLITSGMEFKEFKPRFKSAKTRFKLSAGLNLETFDAILSGTNPI